MQSFYLHTDIGPIHCTQWLPEGNPVGVVQIIHGINEYVGRYDALARFLCSHGYLVVGEDHPGHRSDRNRRLFSPFSPLAANVIASQTVLHRAGIVFGAGIFVPREK